MAQPQVSVSPGAKLEDDKIIRVAAYNRADGAVQLYGHDLNPIVEITWPEFKERPAQQPMGPILAGLGALDVFPPEVLGCIVSQMSVKDALRFRNVNRKARAIVNNQTDYKMATTHAKACFAAVLRTKIAHTLRFADIHRALLQPVCEKCGMVSDVVHLPTLTRCCLGCLMTNQTLSVIQTSELAKMAKMSKRTVDKCLRVLHAPVRPFYMRDLSDGPGCVSFSYAKTPGRMLARTHMVDFTTACEVLHKVKGVTITHVPPQNNRAFAVSCPLPLLDKRSMTSYQALSCKGCAEKFASPALAYVNSLHSRESFLEHFKQCAEAQRLWIASAGGTKNITHREHWMVWFKGQAWLRTYMTRHSLRFVNKA